MITVITSPFLKDSTSRSESIMDTILESQSINEISAFIREGSLKVWQICVFLKRT